jgi:HEAT repeat protein
MATMHVRIDPLAGALASGDEARLVSELRTIKGRRTPREERIQRVLQILDETASPRVRNAAALALADMRAVSAKEKLVELLTRTDTQPSRGTLLYALDELGAKIPIRALTALIAEGSYEAREEALGFLSRSKFEATDGDLRLARRELERVSDSRDAERADAAKAGLEILKSIRPAAAAAE